MYTIITRLSIETWENKSNNATNKQHDTEQQNTQSITLDLTVIATLLGSETFQQIPYIAITFLCASH